MFANRPANPAGLLRLFHCSFYRLFFCLIFCLLVNSCVHCNVPKPAAYFNQTILIHRSANDSATVGQFKLTPKKTFKGSLLTDLAADASPIEPIALVASPTLPTKPIDSARPPLAKPFLGDQKLTSLIEASTTSLSVLVQDDVVQPAKAAATRKFHDEIETLPKPEARVQQPQHTRSRTGSTTIDLSENKFGKPSIQYLNQSRPSTATYVTKNNEVLTVRTPVSKQANKVTDLHIGALFPMTSSHSSGWLGGQGELILNFFFSSTV